MAIEGPLRELGIHDVFQLLDLSRKTGMLRVTSELRHNAGTISFEDGAIVYAEIRSNPHPLGALLLRTGKIAEADLERARDMQSRQGDKRRLGEILVDLGALSPRELQRQVRFQIEEVVFEVMSWREGYFSFTEGPITEIPAEASVRIPTEALLMEGARRIDEWARIEKRVPHLGVVAVFAPPDEGAPGDLDLLPPEWEVLATIDGARDIRAIAHALGKSDFDVAKTLFGLESAGLITLVDPGQQPRPRGASGDAAALVAQAEDALRRRDFERARAAAEQAAAIQPHDAAVHFVLGKIHLGAGRAADAVEELRRAERLDPLLPAAYRLCGFAIRCSPPPIACAGSRSSPWAASPRRSSSGSSGSGSRRAPRTRWRRPTRCARREPRPRCSAPEARTMVDEVKALSAQLAQEPQSLVFLRLGELLRQRRQLDAAQRVALSGLERHPHLADAHDLYARILADRHDYERAFDEWDMTLRIAPEHTGAMKGLAFLYFKVGDLAQAESHLAAAKRVTPDDFTIEQALAMVRGGEGGAEPAPAVRKTPAPPPAPAEEEAKPLAEARVFAGLEGAEEGLLLLDAAGLVLGGGLRSPTGDDVTAAVAAYLAGVSQEAARTAKLLGLGAWRGLSAEGQRGHVHLVPPSGDSLLLVMRDRSVPLGRLAIVAQRAAQAARHWLERQR